MSKFPAALFFLACAPTCVLSKVKVDVYYESGCPFCLKFLSTTLKQFIHTPGVLESLVDLEGHSFGNAYYATPECGGAPYNMINRQCWEKMCGQAAMGMAAPSCYTGELVCQHGEFECKLNRADACMKSLLPTEPMQYMDFAICIQEGAPQAGFSGTEEQLAATCGTTTGTAWMPGGQSCWTGAGDYKTGDTVVQQEASMTPLHPVVPYVTMDGKVFEDHDNLLQGVCKHYVSTPGAIPVQACTNIGVTVAAAVAVAVPTPVAVPAPAVLLAVPPAVPAPVPVPASVPGMLASVPGMPVAVGWGAPARMLFV